MKTIVLNLNDRNKSQELNRINPDRKIFSKSVELKSILYLRYEVGIIIITKGVIATKSNLLTPISLEPNIVKLTDILTTNFVRSNNLSLKYQKFTPLVCKDIGIGKFEFVAIDSILFKRKLLSYELDYMMCIKVSTRITNF